jgi:carbonic anhydrase/acetyltransferase-like protein (isoleucine patch superfamily)
MDNIVYDFQDENGPVPAHQHPYGGGWVADTAHVDITVYIGPEAVVYGRATILEKVRVYGKAKVFDDAEVKGRAEIYDDAEIYGHAEIFQDVHIYEHARVLDRAWVYGNARVYGSAIIHGNAMIENVHAYGNADICVEIDFNCDFDPWEMVKEILIVKKNLPTLLGYHPNLDKIIAQKLKE